jgi:hypothetical protein
MRSTAAAASPWIGEDWLATSNSRRLHAPYIRLPAGDQASRYLQQLRGRVEIVLAKNRTTAEDLLAAHHRLRSIATCLRYPPKPELETESSASHSLETFLNTSQQVAQEMQTLIRQFHPTSQDQRAQISLQNALQKRWDLYADELLFCYDLPGLPQDNLQLEALFGRLRRHQRRISGRKTTRELRDFGQAQVLFIADSELELLNQIQQVPQAVYRRYRQRLADAEAPRQFFYRLHHDPFVTTQTLIRLHSARCLALAHDHSLAHLP